MAFVPWNTHLDSIFDSFSDGELPDSVETLEKSTLGACNIERLDLSKYKKLKVISDSCFEGYQSVTEVILPESLEVLCMEKSIKN